MPISAFDDVAAREWVLSAIRRESARSGLRKSLVRTAIAGRIGISSGTIENIERDRLKGLKSWVRDRIQDYAIRCIEKEIRLLSNELAIVSARRCGADQGQMRAAHVALDNLQMTMKAIRDEA